MGIHCGGEMPASGSGEVLWACERNKIPSSPRFHSLGAMPDGWVGLTGTVWFAPGAFGSSRRNEASERWPAGDDAPRLVQIASGNAIEGIIRFPYRWHVSECGFHFGVQTMDSFPVVCVESSEFVARWIFFVIGFRKGMGERIATFRGGPQTPTSIACGSFSTLPREPDGKRIFQR